MLHCNILVICFKWLIRYESLWLWRFDYVMATFTLNYGKIRWNLHYIRNIFSKNDKVSSLKWAVRRRADGIDRNWMVICIKVEEVDDYDNKHSIEAKMSLKMNFRNTIFPTQRTVFLTSMFFILFFSCSVLVSEQEQLRQYVLKQLAQYFMLGQPFLHRLVQLVNQIFSWFIYLCKNIPVI